MRTLTLRIFGTPAPGGSKKAFVPRRKDGSIVMRAGTNSPVVNITDDGKRNKEWRATVALQARAAIRSQVTYSGPIEFEVVHLIRRPNDHFRGKLREILKPEAPIHHTQKPDALKFARATEDALTGIVWEDDSQNIATIARKRWCNVGEEPGARITITYL